MNFIDQMQKPLDLLKQSLIGIRSGTVSTGLVDSLRVSHYGSTFPLNQMAHSGKGDGIIWVDPFDINASGAILQALSSAGFSAYQFSKTRIVVSIPLLVGKKRRKSSSILKNYARTLKFQLGALGRIGGIPCLRKI